MKKIITSIIGFVILFIIVFILEDKFMKKDIEAINKRLNELKKEE